MEKHIIENKNIKKERKTKMFTKEQLLFIKELCVVDKEVHEDLGENIDRQNLAMSIIATINGKL